MNGCIIFLEILPQKKYKTFSEETIPIIEVPRSENLGEYCLNFLNQSNINIDNLSKTIHEKTFYAFDIKKINLFFFKILEEIKLKSSKFSKYKLAKKKSKRSIIIIINGIYYKKLGKLFIRILIHILN